MNVTVRAVRFAMAGRVVRRTEAVADFMSQRQLGHFGRYPVAVVDEGDDARVEAGHRVRFGVEGFGATSANAGHVDGGTRQPGQSQHPVLKVPAREHVRQANCLVIGLRMQLEEVGRVQLAAVSVLRPAVIRRALGQVVVLDVDHLEGSDAVQVLSFKHRAPVDAADGSKVLGNQRVDVSFR